MQSDKLLSMSSILRAALSKMQAIHDHVSQVITSGMSSLTGARENHRFSGPSGIEHVSMGIQCDQQSELPHDADSHCREDDDLAGIQSRVCSVGSEFGVPNYTVEGYGD